ncbi:DNA/RNA non-specific endonuclease [Nisaea acidiphila]|uniref:Endonuclease n=1 Tax=Nisaea acidiphila TaxID=1862145 RepID=A0A9J7AY12_9PROT|nr:DNA/RNA non-specific endonuclease [Nisaea acidiphila]UUX52168.1 DNA/RNA non-specific endonuclease [Nisaea acidiphila]
MYGFPRQCRLSGLSALLLLLIFPRAPLLAEPLLDPNCLQACPKAQSENLLVRRESHTLSNNAATKFADWVAYEVAPADIGKSKKRVWRADPEIPPEETLEPADYKGAHKALKTDRGHQAPLASFSNAPDWATTNYLSNITPQKSALNQGPWKNLESAVRTLAKSDAGTVHVLTGPLYEHEMPALPEADEPHRVPSGYWKIVLLTREGTVLAAGFVLDQETSRRADYCDGRHDVSVSEIARRSGLVFAPGTVSAPAGDLRTRLGCTAPVSVGALPD